MKKILTGILAFAAVFCLCAPCFASETDAAYTVSVSGHTLDLSDLPTAPYAQGGTIMVPLRKIGEALGYKIGWDAETGAITVDDEYIQKATLYAGTAAVVFEGRLTVINMSRELENSVETVIHDGCTYVPLEFFQEFFNDTAVEGTAVTIAPSMCEISSYLEQ